MNCPDCRLFFVELHRRCTIHLNGECDCPICQGVCDCKRPVVEQLRPSPPAARPTRKFGEPR